ncbi:hypothetical protein [Agrobacterium vitis]|uniref:hypothetical protein n=1 Tax=Agrobacterium vitis TaxID=373 RepID=UPI0015767DF3|nr:hypothetical protein G6L01_020945 [Agrobacterium vitis]
MSTVKIYIADNRLHSALRVTASIFLLVIGPIAIGVLANSQALQWAGFIFGWLTFVGYAARLTRRYTSLSIAEARKRLDEMEKEGAA